MLQKDAELVFSKQRATTDPTKLDDFQTAHAELLCALKLFTQLQVVGTPWLRQSALGVSGAPDPKPLALASSVLAPLVPLQHGCKCKRSN